MKKFYLCFVLVLSCALVACDDDDDVAPQVDPLEDTVSPTIHITSPASTDNFLLIERVGLVTRLEDNVGFSIVRVFFIYPDGEDSLAYASDNISAYTKTLDLELALRLSRGAPTGTYKLMVEAKDKAHNIAQESVSINFHASDLNLDDFTSILPTGSIFEAYDWGWWGMDFSSGFALNEISFNYLLFMMIDEQGNYEVSKDEWNKFIADFNIKNQSWADWDENSNGSISDAEFDRAVSKLNLFREWDTNYNAILNKREFASGVFSRWDNNQDGLLNQEEYLERFYTYMVRGGRR